MGKVFISYRRHDSAGYVRALVNEMKRTFGDGQAFLDLESIGAGTDFVAAIDAAVRASEVVLAMIGPDWLTAADERGRRRLDDPDDFVRLEIATAFRLGIPVIPILLEETRMPPPEAFPGELSALATLQALRLSHSRWDDDLDWLFRAIEVVTEEPRLARRYLEAQTLAGQGQWQSALERFESIAAERADFRDTAEQMAPLQWLAAESTRLGARPGGWRRAAVRWPIIAMLLMALPSNILAGVFNFLYNFRVVVHPMQVRGIPNAESLFLSTSLAVNSVGFAIGIAVFIAASWPLRIALRRPGTATSTLRPRCLGLGVLAAVTGAGLWLLAGPVYPAMLGAMDWRDYAFFVSSLCLGGLIASAYPFFLVTWLCTRVFYPELLRPGATGPADAAALERLDSTTWKFLILAGSVPMLAIAGGLVLSPLSQSGDNAFLLGLLGLASFAGFLVTIWLFRDIQRDLAVLKELVRRSRPS